jgi:hypothetical protein
MQILCLARANKDLAKMAILLSIIIIGLYFALLHRYRKDNLPVQDLDSEQYLTNKRATLKRIEDRMLKKNRQLKDWL